MSITVVTVCCRFQIGSLEKESLALRIRLPTDPDQDTKAQIGCEDAHRFSPSRFLFSLLFPAPCFLLFLFFSSACLCRFPFSSYRMLPQHFFAFENEEDDDTKALSRSFGKGVPWIRSIAVECRLNI